MLQNRILYPLANVRCTIESIVFHDDVPFIFSTSSQLLSLPFVSHFHPAHHTYETPSSQTTAMMKNEIIVCRMLGGQCICCLHPKEVAGIKNNAYTHSVIRSHEYSCFTHSHRAFNGIVSRLLNEWNVLPFLFNKMHFVNYSHVLRFPLFNQRWQHSINIPATDTFEATRFSEDAVVLERCPQNTYLRWFSAIRVKLSTLRFQLLSNSSPVFGRPFRCE